jgi:hypothetical protein
MMIFCWYASRQNREINKTMKLYLVNDHHSLFDVNFNILLSSIILFIFNICWNATIVEWRKDQGLTLKAYWQARRSTTSGMLRRGSLGAFSS